MISWLKRAIFGRPAVPSAVEARPEVRFEVPDGFAPVEPPPVQAKPLYESPIIPTFQTADKAVTAHVITEQDHDGLEYHRKDAKRMVNEAGGSVTFMHNLKDGYTLAASLGQGRNLHRRASTFVTSNGTTIIGTVDIDFEATDDPRAVALIRTASDRLSLAKC